MINTENREHLIRTLEEKLGCSLSTLAELLREEVNSEFKQVQEPYKAVTKLMQDIGIPANLFGFNYIREGIILSINHPEWPQRPHITKDLYPAIAKAFNTTPNRVERAIRHAIEAALERGNIDILEKMFSSKISSRKVKPTNGEFFATCLEYMRMYMN